jgi:hypothetical protein
VLPPLSAATYSVTSVVKNLGLMSHLASLVQDGHMETRAASWARFVGGPPHGNSGPVPLQARSQFYAGGCGGDHLHKHCPRRVCSHARARFRTHRC